MPVDPGTRDFHGVGMTAKWHGVRTCAHRVGIMQAT